MIDVQAKIHDQYTLEFKVGYITRNKLPTSDFVMNTWIFIPDSLDINHRTYTKDMFYRDVRSQMRLITPIYTIYNLAEKDSLPFNLLRQSCEKVIFNPSVQNMENFESQVKMYASIYKSAVRNAYNHILYNKKGDRSLSLSQDLILNVKTVLYQYRSLRTYMKTVPETSPVYNYYRIADEFISNVTEQHLFYLLDFLRVHHLNIFNLVHEELFLVLDSEVEYKKQMHYLYVSRDDKNDNRDFVYNAGLLKKYVESNLYLKAYKRQNTFFMEQIAFMFAAGISMIFATVISFSFQQTFGNFTLPFFIALVVSYMFKDRIKELIRFYFANKLGSKFFDYKTVLKIRDVTLGWFKEGFDYIRPNKLPLQVREKRSRTSLLETRRGINEKVILYRKKVHLNKKDVGRINQYSFLGVNDILRFNLFEFMRKMDNSKVPVYADLGDRRYERITASKMYYINYIVQCQYQGVTSKYYRYRIMLGKEGITEIEKVDHL